MSKFHYIPQLLSLSRSCRACAEGRHQECLEHPSADGAFWYKEFDEEGNPTLDETGYPKRRLYKRDPLTQKEIPRDPCECMTKDHIGEPGTCSRFLQEGGRCGRPAKGTITIRGHYGRDCEIEVCGLHLSVETRKKKRKEKYAAEAKALREKAARQEEAYRASRDWAEKFEREFGIEAFPMSPVDLKIRIAISPEQSYALLSEVRALLDEVFEEHPFRRSD